MNKKASINKSSELILHLVILALVITIFLTVLIKIKDNKLHDLKVESRDYAFTKEAISMTNNPINYKYKIRENITIETKQDPCIISVKFEKDKTLPTLFPCSKNNFKVINEEITKKEVKINA